MDLEVPYWAIVLIASSLILSWWWIRTHTDPSSYRPFQRAALAEASNKDACTPYARRKPDWVVHEVLRLKVLMGAGGCRKIATTFNRLHRSQAHTVGKSFVAHCIQTRQHTLIQLRREMHRQRPRPVPVNAVWAMDLTFYACTSGQQHCAPTTSASSPVLCSPHF
jgi:putative transposase